MARHRDERPEVINTGEMWTKRKSGEFDFQTNIPLTIKDRKDLQ